MRVHAGGFCCFDLGTIGYHRRVGMKIVWGEFFICSLPRTHIGRVSFKHTERFIGFGKVRLGGSGSFGRFFSHLLRNPPNKHNLGLLLLHLGGVGKILHYLDKYQG